MATPGSPSHHESARLLNPDMVYRSPIDAASPGSGPDGRGKLLFNLPFTLASLFRPLMVLVAIIDAILMLVEENHWGRRRPQRVFFIIVAFAFAAWSLLCMLPKSRRKGSSVGCSVDFGFFTCICCGRSRDDDDDDDGGHDEKKNVWVQPLLDLIWAVTLLVISIVIIGDWYYFMSLRGPVIAFWLILAIFQFGIAGLGVVARRLRFRIALYREGSDDETVYRIHLPRDPPSRKQGGPLSVAA